MSDEREPLARARLLDGRELIIEQDAARVDDRRYPIARIQEARLLFLKPETIGLRMADVGLVEYSVAQPGDGMAALEAIYRLRPELRRPDLPPPAPEAPPGYLMPPPAVEPLAPPPMASGPQVRPEFGPEYTPPPGAPGYGSYTGQGYRPGYRPVVFPELEPTPFPPEVTAEFGPEPNRTHATLTPQPRSAGELIGATFRLFGKRLSPLLKLSLMVALLPQVALGLLAVAIDVLAGTNPFAPAMNPLTALQQPPPSTPSPAAATPVDAAVSLLALIGTAAGLVVAGWTLATLTIAAREAALGRPISLGACVREGWARLWPTLSAYVMLTVALVLIAVPGLGLALGFALMVIQPQAGAPPVSASGAPVLLALAAVLSISTLALLAWIWTRLTLAPTAAALGIRHPFVTAWTLTRGGMKRVFIALIVVTAVTSVLTVPATLAQFFSNGVSVLALVPLAALVAAPLGALAHVVTLYDLRLRREGYALFTQEGVTSHAPEQDTKRASGQGV